MEVPIKAKSKMRKHGTELIDIVVQSFGAYKDKNKAYFDYFNASPSVQGSPLIVGYTMADHKIVYARLGIVDSEGKLIISSEASSPYCMPLPAVQHTFKVLENKANAYWIMYSPSANVVMSISGPSLMNLCVKIINEMDRRDRCEDIQITIPDNHAFLCDKQSFDNYNYYDWLFIHGM